MSQRDVPASAVDPGPTESTARAMADARAARVDLWQGTEKSVAFALAASLCGIAWLDRRSTLGYRIGSQRWPRAGCEPVGAKLLSPACLPACLPVCLTRSPYAFTNARSSRAIRTSEGWWMYIMCPASK